MQVFEFHFNPRLRQGFGGQAKTPDLIFDSFCFEPENVYEKRVGSLYMVGFLKNILPQNIRFLENLTKVIKEEYYKSTLLGPEKAFKESLKEANGYLEGIAKKGDVSWLGNLNFAALSLKNLELNFTKVSEIKIFLLRAGQIIDIDKRLKFQEIEPYPLKIFGNIISGKLAEDDLILVLTKEAADYFQVSNLITEVAKIIPFDGKKLRKILENREGELTKISGVCLLIFLSKEVTPLKREAIFPKLPRKEFSFKKLFSPVINFLKSRIKKPRPRPPKLKLGKIRFPTLKIPQIKIGIPKLKFKIPPLNKNLILILGLIFLLGFGFFISRIEEKNQIKAYQTTLNQIQAKIDKAESFLILKKTNPELEKEANTLLKESFEEISPLLKISSSLPKDIKNQVFSLREKIEKNLFELNKLVEIENPELIFEFEPREFIPQKMFFFKGDIYFFTPYAQNLFKINQELKGEVIQIDKKLNVAVSLGEEILFFSKPNQLLSFRDGKVGETVLFELPSPDSEFSDFNSFKSNLYFLDTKSGQIVKYPYLGDSKWDKPKIWLEIKKATDFRSMAVDGSVWILTRGNSIERYYAGNLQETLSPDIFPYPKGFTKISTSPFLPLLYILEPIQKRIVILNKRGVIVKQFQSEKFDNLLDFSVSENGKTIYLLNGLKVYQITTEIR